MTLNWEGLKEGSLGSDVAAVQELLKKLGITIGDRPVEATGEFDSRMYLMIRGFKLANKGFGGSLGTCSGQVDRPTLEILLAATDTSEAKFEVLRQRPWNRRVVQNRNEESAAPDEEADTEELLDSAFPDEEGATEEGNDDEFGDIRGDRLVRP